jgi:hypothetical protein
MAFVDYMKAVQFLADSLEASAQINVGNADNRLNDLLITMTDSAGNNKTCIVTLNKYEMILAVPIEYFSGDAMTKWLRALEYHLEQEYRMNIKVEHSALSDNHRVIIRY